jgi:hypothetical protein
MASRTPGSASTSATTSVDPAEGQPKRPSLVAAGTGSRARGEGCETRTHEVAPSTLRRRAHGLGGPAGDRKADTRLVGRICLDEGFYLHRQGPAGVSSQIMFAAVRGRSSGPIQPAAGISILSAETICGPRLSPPRCSPPPGRHRGLHHRRSVAVEVGFEPTEDLRLHTLSSTAHHRSPASASVRTSTDVGHAVAGERPRTGVNETKTEPRQRFCWPGRGLAIPSRANDS